jgi:hypothetical protein
MENERSLEELREMAQLTAQIRKNLKIINRAQTDVRAMHINLEERTQQAITLLAKLEAVEEKLLDINLDHLETQTDTIDENLTTIQDGGDWQLDELEEQTSRIAANLNAIEESDLDLDELETQSANTAANLKTIEEAG